MGDPLVLLACKGVTKDNKTDIKVLVAAIQSIIPTQGYNIKKPGADQLTVICMLLEDLQHHSTPQDDNAPVTKKQLEEALQCLMDTINTAPTQPPADNTCKCHMTWCDEQHRQHSQDHPS
jgi:hypothetical protein